jgi:hypothetical protein
MLFGCANKEDVIVRRITWDGEPAIDFCYPDGNMGATFKIKDLKKLEIFLYDKQLDYTDKYKSWKGWLHEFKGKRVELKK